MIDPVNVLSCPHCLANKINVGVTCGRSKCQEAEYHANAERNRIKSKPKRIPVTSVIPPNAIACADKPMTEQEWFSLYILAVNASGEARLTGNPTAADYYARLANKAALRADAAAEGRCVP